MARALRKRLLDGLTRLPAGPQRAFRVIAVALCLVAFGRSARAESADAEPACVRDVQAAFGFAERNYAGYRDKLDRFGEDAYRAAEREALERAQNAAEPCLQIITDWLRVFRDGHMGVEDPNSAGSLSDQLRAPATRAGEPSFERLFANAVLLRIPSFFPAYAEPIRQLVRDHADDLDSAEFLVIDVRGNGGGMDSAYAQLAELIHSGPVPSIGADVLATPENIAAWQRLDEYFSPEFRAQWDDVLERVMESPGGFVSFTPDSLTDRRPVRALPRRVGILIDRRCGSSCEQFLLEARQSQKVKMFGTRSNGNLDYGNVRPFPLPSGRVLWLATTRSRRLPDQPVDGIGVRAEFQMDPTRFSGPERLAALEEVLQALGRNEDSSPRPAQ